MCEKSAVPCAANIGTAASVTNSSAAAMRAKLLLRVIRFSLELVADVEPDQVAVGLVRAVEVVTADAVRAACLEVQRHLGEIDDERTVVVADSEARCGAVGIRKERADAGGRLRVLIEDETEADIPVRGHTAVRAEAVGVRVLPVLR